MSDNRQTALLIGFGPQKIYMRKPWLFRAEDSPALDKSTSTV